MTRNRRGALTAAWCLRAEKSIFAADAVALIHEHATGALRDIDRIAHGAMRDASRRKRKTVDREAVERVLAGRMPID